MMRPLASRTRTGTGAGAKLRFHDLRGSHETALLDAGVPVHVVAQRCGHDPAVLLRSYASGRAEGRQKRSGSHRLDVKGCTVRKIGSKIGSKSRFVLRDPLKSICWASHAGTYSK